MTSAGPAHLAQLPLGDNDQAILASLSGWLSTARFEKHDDLELCTDEQLAFKWETIKKMGLAQKVQYPTSVRRAR